jgi:hypothetical protein
MGWEVEAMFVLQCDPVLTLELVEGLFGKDHYCVVAILSGQGRVSELR